MRNVDPIQPLSGISPVPKIDAGTHGRGGTFLKKKKLKDSFQDTLHEQLEKIEELDSSLQTMLIELPNLAELEAEDVGSISERLTSEALRFSDILHTRFKITSAETDKIRPHMEQIIDALFFLVNEYGSSKALKGLVSIWIDLKPDSKIFLYLDEKYVDWFKEKSLPLNRLKKNSEEEKAKIRKRLRAEFWEIFKKKLLDPKAAHLFKIYRKEHPPRTEIDTFDEV